MAGLAHWLEHQPADQRVTDLIPDKGTCLSCRFNPLPLSDHVQEATSDVSHICLSVCPSILPSLSLPSLLSSTLPLTINGKNIPG